MSPFTVSVHNIKPYLIDFLLGQYPDYVEDGKLISSLEIYPGQCIHELLTAQPVEKVKNEISSESCLIIILPLFNQFNVYSRNYLSENSQNIFKKRMRAHFKATLVNYIQEAMRSDIDFIDAIERFMEIKRINTENITKNALIKHFYRFRKRENNDNYLDFSKKKHYLKSI